CSPGSPQLRRHAPAKDYYSSAGYGPLRETIAAHMTARTGRDHSAEDISAAEGAPAALAGHPAALLASAWGEARADELASGPVVSKGEAAHQAAPVSHRTDLPLSRAAELLFLLQMCLDADLLLPSPSWVSYQPQAQMLGRRTLWVDTTFESGWKVTAAGLERTLDHHSRFASPQPRLLVLNAPSNPTGVTYSEDELRDIADVCRRHGVMVLSDEIYGRLTFDADSPPASGVAPDSGGPAFARPGHTHASISRFLPDQTIILDGISKWAGAGGWRLGAFCFPKSMGWLRQVMTAAASETFSAVSAPVQHAAIPAFAEESEDAMAAYLASANRVLHLVASFHTDSLRSAGARVRSPHGGFYVFPDVTGCPGVQAARERFASESGGQGPMTSGWLAQDILHHTGVAMLPGTAFGRARGELTFRIAYVDFDGAEAMAALGRGGSNEALDTRWQGAGSGPEAERQAAYLAEFCPSIVQGTEKLCKFLGGTARDHEDLLGGSAR
ncbi:dapX, partial [Symbiodinium sp. KB8]